MTESSERQPTTTLADALAKVSVTDTEAAVFLEAIARTVNESHTEFQTAVREAAYMLAYGPPAETKPAGESHARSTSTRQTVSIGKDD